MKLKNKLSILASSIVPLVSISFLSCTNNKIEKEPNKDEDKLNETKVEGLDDNNGSSDEESDQKLDEKNNNVDSTDKKVSKDDNDNQTNISDDEKDKVNDSSSSVEPSLPPTFSPNFNFGNQDYKEQNSYPEYINKFTKIDAKDIYQEIYDRSFMLGYSFRDEDELDITIDAGTAWLLDYYKYKEGNKYKLFFASNLHVLRYFSNAMDEKYLEKYNYKDYSGKKLLSVFLGKSNQPVNFDNIPNKSWVRHVKDNGGPAHRFDSSFFDNPKLVFAAFDFMDDKSYEPFNDDIRKIYSEYKEENDPDREKFISFQSKLKNPDFLPFYKDFAVFEITFDFDKQVAPEKQEEFNKIKDQIQKAVSSLDHAIERSKKSILPNVKKQGNYLIDYDYYSAAKILETQKNDNLLGNAKEIYIGGYPSDNGESYWMKNIPTERYNDSVTYFKSPKNKDAFVYSTNDIQNPSNHLRIYTTVWNRVFVEQYGPNFTTKFSSLYHGASGSLALNDFGQIVGIYSTVSERAQFGDLLKISGITPLLQTNDIKIDDKVFYAHNLLDKTNFEHQKTSYRSNLEELYPNGFENDNNLKTALFPNLKTSTK
ncbi:MIP family Ig-specific serine endopeptidase [Mycoplasmopsis sturni]|uniref:MIP family Ig-specific serine endopeptidase n=1 Tax=Mycoplasmopsis sturni TaxID=39047 RepID=UPI00056D6147|nr:DUF31 family protein [Mycoplasmopsis sturni]